VRTRLSSRDAVAPALLFRGKEDTPMLLSPVDTLLIDLGNQLAPFAAGCVIFTGGVLVALFAAMFADLRSRRPPVQPRVPAHGAARPLPA
jgi:hypothetical protein